MYVSCTAFIFQTHQKKHQLKTICHFRIQIFEAHAKMKWSKLSANHSSSHPILVVKHKLQVFLHFISAFIAVSSISSVMQISISNSCDYCQQHSIQFIYVFFIRRMIWCEWREKRDCYVYILSKYYSQLFIKKRWCWKWWPCRCEMFISRNGFEVQKKASQRPFILGGEREKTNTNNRFMDFKWTETI